MKASGVSQTGEGFGRWHRRWPLLVVLTVLLVILGFIWIPRSAGQDSSVQTGGSVEISGQLVKQQFAMADTVRITAQVTDDIFAAGREVTLDGARAQTLVVGAGKLVIRNSTIRELIAGGLEVEISGTIEDDAVVGVCPICPMGSGAVLIGKDARIGHDARIASGTLEVQGDIAGDLEASARRIVISGRVGGKTDLKASEIVIGDNARLDGELIARSPSKPQISGTAVVVGPVQEIPIKVEIPEPAELAKTFLKVATAAAAALAAGLLVLGVITQLLLPQFVQASVESFWSKPWATLGVGLVCALVTPVVVVLLFATVIGAPTAVVALAVFLAMAALALVTAGYGIGLWVRSRATRAETQPGTGGRVGWTVLGMLALFAIAAVPFVGWVFALLSVIAGLGAVVTCMREWLVARTLATQDSMRLHPTSAGS